MAAQSPLSLKLRAADANASVFLPVAVKDIAQTKSQSPYRIFNWDSAPQIAGADISAIQIRHYLDKTRPVLKMGVSQPVKPSRYVYGITVPVVNASVPVPGSSPVFSVVGVVSANLTINVEGTVDAASKTEVHYLMQQLLNGFVLSNFVDGTNVLT